MKLEDLVKNKSIAVPPPKTEVEVTQQTEAEPSEDTQNISVAVKSEFPNYLIYDPEVVGYPDLEFQNSIYDWVNEYMLKYTSYTVKDYGCGRGDFGERFSSRSYIGIDSNKVMIDAGNIKYPNLNLVHDNYLNVDVITDFTVCIGTLNVNNGIDKWELFNTTLTKAIETTTKEVVFVLSKNTGEVDFNDYPIEELIPRIPTNLPYKIDYSKFEDIYILVVYLQPFS